MTESAFSLFTPSVFVICSPFQAFCAVSAIKNLKISEYHFIVLLFGDIRDQQILDYLIEERITFHTMSITGGSLRKYLLKALYASKRKYKRIFVGDFRNLFLLSIGLTYAKKGAYLVYLDDGNVTISLFKDSFYEWGSKRHWLAMNAIAKYRGITLLKNFYTIYSDIENPNYIISNNDLSANWQRRTANRNFVGRGIVFIGTNMERYCNPIELPRHSFVRELKNIIKTIKDTYPSEVITYIPHGRDPSLYAQDICDVEEINFLRLGTMVENYVNNLYPPPLAVYGFGSSALFNIKKLIPTIKVFNILLYSDANNVVLGKLEAISDYYISNGIRLIRIKANPSIQNKI